MASCSSLCVTQFSTYPFDLNWFDRLSSQRWGCFEEHCKSVLQVKVGFCSFLSFVEEYSKAMLFLSICIEILLHTYSKKLLEFQESYCFKIQCGWVKWLSFNVVSWFYYLPSLQGWFEQQALPVQPPWQHGHCWGRAKECPAASLWGHPAGGNHITHHYLWQTAK